MPTYTICKICNKKYRIKPYEVKITKYCSLKCKYKAGHTEETKKKISFTKKGTPSWNKGVPCKEITKKKLSKYFKGKFTGRQSPHWKGDKKIGSDGYILLYKPNHPYHDIRNCVRENRLVVEKQIDRYLLPKERTHHLNKVKIDNCPKNLMAFTSESAHQRFHHNLNNVKPEEIIFDGRNLK